jgi:hypothetical protein
MLKFASEFLAAVIMESKMNNVFPIGTTIIAIAF